MQQVGRKAQIHDAKLVKKDGFRAQISSMGHKLLYEIHPRSKILILQLHQSHWSSCAKLNRLAHSLKLVLTSLAYPKPCVTF
jgi:hypothetical protein